jgi:hypothetical protein
MLCMRSNIASGGGRSSSVMCLRQVGCSSYVYELAKCISAVHQYSTLTPVQHISAVHQYSTPTPVQHISAASVQCSASVQNSSASVQYTDTSAAHQCSISTERCISAVRQHQSGICGDTSVKFYIVKSTVMDMCLCMQLILTWHFRL